MAFDTFFVLVRYKGEDRTYWLAEGDTETSSRKKAVRLSRDQARDKAAELQVKHPGMIFTPKAV